MAKPKTQKKTGKKFQSSPQSKKKKIVECGEKKKTVEEKKQLHQDVADIQGKSSRLIGDYERIRGYSIEVYASPEHWGDLLEKSDHFAWVYHDRDKKEDGSPKLPHYHILLRFKEGKTKEAVRKLTKIGFLDKDTTILFQRLQNKTQAFEYLMHNTDEARKQGKTPYTIDEVHVDDFIYWRDVNCKDDSENLLEDITNKDFTYRDLAIKYGRDFMLNFRRYEDFIGAMQAEEASLRVKKLQDELASQLDSVNAYYGEELIEILTDHIADVIIDSYNFERKGKRDSQVLAIVLKKITNDVERKVFEKI